MEFKIVYQELVNSTEMIRALIKDIGQEQAQVKPDAKSWSILEVVCHLHDEEREDFRFSAPKGLEYHPPSGDACLKKKSHLLR